MSMGKCDERYRNVFCSGTFEESIRNRGCVIIRHVFVVLQMLYKYCQYTHIQSKFEETIGKYFTSSSLKFQNFPLIQISL